MNTNIKEIVKTLELQKSSDEIINHYADAMKALYQSYAYIQLAMNQYMFCETEEDMRDCILPDNTYQEICEVIRKQLLTGNPVQDRHMMAEKLEKMRQQVISCMQDLTGYADVFSFYEYIWNRIEYRFKNDEMPHNYSDEEFTRTIMNYIVADQDNVVVNERIAQVVEQLPVRMTKGHFLQLLEEGMNVYSSAQKKSFDDFLYMLRTSTTLAFQRSDNPKFEKLNLLLDKIESADCKDTTAEMEQVVKNCLLIATESLERQVDLCMMLQKLINLAYVIVLGNEALTEETEVNDSIAVLTMLDERISKGVTGEFEAQEEEMLFPLEGCQEQIYEQFAKYEYMMEQLLSREQITTNQKEVLEGLSRMRDLLSDSLFVQWEEHNTELMEEQEFEQKKQQVLDEFAQYFKEHSKYENRAVMAITLGLLPVFFNQLTEIQDYVFGALKNCGDRAEKLATIELLTEIVELW